MRIHSKNKANLENVARVWNDRLALEGVQKKKRKHERSDRYEVKEMGSGNQVLLRFFKDGLNSNWNK